MNSRNLRIYKSFAFINNKPRPFWASLKAQKAGGKRPAALARAAPTTPPREPMKTGRGRLPAGHPPAGGG